MKKSLIIYVIALLSGVMLYSCKANDEKIQREVQNSVMTTSSGVQSSVKNGVVTLTGTVESEETKNAAEQAAKSVKDVKSVNNNIQVNAPRVVNPDETLTTRINNNFSSAGISGINVSVMNGEVTLTGDINRADLTRVMQIAQEANPTKVNNQLTVK